MKKPTEFPTAATVITALKTPFNPEGEIDWFCYANLLERQLEAGIEAVVVAGTTGEGHLLSQKEIVQLVKKTGEIGGAGLQIIANVGGASTKKTLDLGKEALEAGADKMLSVNPYYGKTSAEGMMRHFELLLNVGPLIIYNVPSRTAQDIPPEIVHHLAKSSNFSGIKECAGLDRIKLHVEAGIKVWSGNDEMAFAARHRLGAAGVISIASNVIPKPMRQLMDSSDENFNASLEPFLNWLFCEPNPIPLNTLMAMLKLIQPVFKLPYVPLSLEKRQLGLNLLKSLEISEPELEKLSLLRSEDFVIVN